MTTPTVADLLAYAALMNGRCEKCKRILPHKDSGKTHECKEDAAWSDREAAIREVDEIAVMVAHYEPDALAAIVLEVRAELAAAREDRDEFAALIHRLQDKLAAAEEREAKLREALRAVCDVGDRAAVQVARAALADGEGET